MGATRAFCPSCGKPAVLAAAPFCGARGGAVPADLHARLAGVAGMPGTTAGAVRRHEPSAPAAGSTRRSIGTFTTVREVLLAALAPIAAWAAVTSVLAAFAGDLVRNALLEASGGLAAPLVGAEGLSGAGTAAIGSLLAGLGFDLHVAANASFLGMPVGRTGDLSVSLLPIGPLACLAIAIGAVVARSARRNPGASASTLAVRAAAAAVVASLAIFVASLATSPSVSIASDPGTGGIPGIGGLVTASAAITTGPSAVRLVLVLFPTLLAGALLGAATVVRPRLPTAPIPAAALLGVTGYAAGLVLAMPFALLLVGMTADVRLLALLLASLPNAAATLVAAGTGSPFLATGLGIPADLAARSLWDAGPVWIAAGTASLLLAGLLTGIVARARQPQVSTAVLAGAGAVAGLLLVCVGRVAIPAVSASFASAETSIGFDPVRALVVAVPVSMALAWVGFRLGPVVLQRTDLRRPDVTA